MTVAVSGVLFTGFGVGLFLWLKPRPGILSLLCFHLACGALLFSIAYLERTQHYVGWLPWLAGIAYVIPALLFHFSFFLAEAFLKESARPIRLFLPYLVSGSLWIGTWLSPWLQARLPQVAAIYFALAYILWLFRLIHVWKSSPLILDRFAAKYLLAAQAAIFLIPYSALAGIYAWKRPFEWQWMCVAALTFPAALIAGIFPARKRQTETYIVQSEKRKSFGGLLAGLAHEINNPLNFIYSNLEPMREMLEKLGKRIPESDTEARRLLSELNQMSQSMEDGVETIRALTEKFRGFPKARPETKESVDVNQVLDKSVELLAHKWKNKLNLQRRFGEIPPVRGFAMELGQAFTNLIANACDATPEGGTVEVRSQNAVGGVNVWVRDSGTGISRDDIPKIFDPFFTTKKQGEGTGLGLSIAQQIIKSHRGSIEVQSTSGKGTEFLVFLPVQA